MSPSPGADAEPVADLTAARDLVRAAAKWFIAGLGAIGAILIAGSQLSSVGALPPGSGRLYLAIGGVVVGLLAILWAMWRVVDVLAGHRWTFEEIVRDCDAVREAKSGGMRERRSRAKHPVGWFFFDTPSALADFDSPTEILELYEESEADRDGLDDLVGLMNDMLEKAATIHLQAQFQRLRRQIAAGVLIGAVGIILFAWAANPPKPEQPAPSLRHANLRYVDLRGSSLRNADLTGADLTGGNLRDSDLRGAMIEGVIWSNTTCPDGTNSDSSARAAVNASDAVAGTCEGHLSPVG